MWALNGLVTRPASGTVLKTVGSLRNGWGSTPHFSACEQEAKLEITIQFLSTCRMQSGLHMRWSKD